MSQRVHTRQEKLILYKKLALAAAVVIVLCVIAAAVLKYADSKQLEAEEEYGSELEVVEINGKKYVPKKNIEVYLFIGVDVWDEVTEATDYGEAGQCDYLYLMVRDLSDGTYKTLPINRNTITTVKTIDLDGSYLGESDIQIAFAHAHGNGMEDSCENVVDAVSNLLYGQEIDGYAAVNMGAISIMNNLADGVTVTIEDDFSKVDESLVMGETITLTDEQAVTFVRGRTNVADETNENRMERQSVYMDGLEKNLKAKIQTDGEFPLEIYEALQDYMVTNINSQKFSKLALLVASDKNEGELTIEGIEGIDDTGFATFEADEESLGEVVAELFYKEYEE